MRTRPLGDSGYNLSLLGIGTWAIGGADWDYGWGSQKDKDSEQAILKALEKGFNWIDTAACYGLGHSEKVVGKAVKEFKEKVIIATKCGLVPAGDGSVEGCLKKESIIRECEDSLRRLDTDVIDIYQIHWPNPAADINEAFAAMQTLKQQGKIICSGVSNFSVKQMQSVMPFGKISSLQPLYNMINRRIEDETLAFCSENKIGVVAYSPIASGFFTEKMSRERVFLMDDNDWRKNKNPAFKDPELTVNLDLLEELKLMAKGLELNVSELALAWVLRREEVTSAIVGFRSPSQVEGVLKAAEIVLTADEAEHIEKLLEQRKKSLQSLS